LFLVDEPLFLVLEKLLLHHLSQNLFFHELGGIVMFQGVSIVSTTRHLINIRHTLVHFRLSIRSREVNENDQSGPKEGLQSGLASGQGSGLASGRESGQ
jgi:hypothetical protein